MTTLTLIYAVDAAGDFTDPKTDKCWNVDRDFFRETIKDKSIICGRKTLEQDWKGMKGAAHITVLSHQYRLERNLDLDVPVQNCGDLLTALAVAKRKPGTRGEEFYCVGGKRTIEAFAPFASRMLITFISPCPSYNDPWLPEYLQNDFDLKGGNVWQTSAEDGSPQGIEPQWTRFEARRFQPIEF